MTKRPGATSDNGFIFRKINEDKKRVILLKVFNIVHLEKEKREKKIFLWAVLEGCTNRALFDPCMKF